MGLPQWCQTHTLSEFIDLLGYLEPKKEKKMNDEITHEDIMALGKAMGVDMDALPAVDATEADTVPEGGNNDGLYTLPEILGYGQEGEGKVATTADVATL